MTDERETLIQRRNELRERLQAIQQTIREGLPNELEEQAVVLENLETQEEISRVTRVELERVEQQLAELDRSGET